MPKPATERRKISLGFAPEEFYEGQHICLIYNDDKERLAMMAKYLSSGLEAGEKMIYMVDTMSPDEFIEAMAGYGLDIPSHKNDIAVVESFPAHCPNGRFDGKQIVEKLAKYYDDAISEGYTGTRGAGELSWTSAKGWGRIEDVIAFEAHLEQLIHTHPHTACCHYDARKFDGATLMDVLSIHPVMIVRGQLVQNPYYVKPEIFLEEFKERRNAANA